ncbi:MAG: right-handed parallel beta-helix repeat-containing protein [Archangiaceae bacterium]|nr:right-handed parallel beta-helix repeat-containing protein [Archangiaceae bacterium]
MRNLLAVLVLCGCSGMPGTGGDGGGTATAGGSGGSTAGGAGGATAGGAAAGGSGGATAGGTGGATAGGSGGSTAGGSGGSTAGGAGGARAGGSGGASGGSAGGAMCPDAGMPMATGTTRDFTGSGTLQTLVAMSAPGDRIRVAAGTYGAQSITAKPSGDVFIEAAAGASPTFAGLTCNGCTHLYLRGLKFTGTVDLGTASFITLDTVSIDLGTQDASGLYIHGSGSATGMSHDITVVRSSIHNGARTIFILTNFSPNANWNHHLTFVNSDFQCGTHNCFQVSGGRDLRIENNVFHDPKGDGVLTAGGVRIDILRNRMRGSTANVVAVRLATPGTEWDNFAGVENMISSDITVANNVISGWVAAGVELDAATNIRVVYNTVAGPVGFKTWHRTPHDQANNVILNGNSNMTVWNNIFPTLQIDGADPMPSMIGTNLVGGSPMYVDTVSYQLAAGSPALDKGVVNAQTPLVDFTNAVRGAMPDYGALERGAPAPACP